MCLRFVCEMGLIGSHLIRQRVHDDRVGHQAQRMDLAHQHIGRDLVELNVLEEVAQHLLQRQVLRVKVHLPSKGGISLDQSLSLN